MSFQNTSAFAQQQDVQDPLKSYRDKFFFPQHNGKDVLYFCGNSLGLQPKAVADSIKIELEDWAKYGVEGHLQGRRPWYSYHEMFAEGAARLVGAKPNEVVVMNQLTVNLHLLLLSFYQPKGKRRKILFETKPFPSDQYAFASQAQLHGLDAADVLVELQPRDGELTLRTDDIIQKINELGDELAVVCIGAVNYFTGQYFDLKRITEAAHAVGAYSGFDLAHAAGNVPMQLHAWHVDFACWCSYKYLNSGPGGVAGAFVHEQHASNKSLMRLAGWWGHNKQTRFDMKPDFEPMTTAEAWQLSNAPVMSMAVHKVALDMFTEVGMEALRKKSVQLTAYLAFILDEVKKATGVPLQIITPMNAEERGAHLSVIVSGADKSLVQKLSANGVVVDWREPNVIRLAPVPLYNSFEDVYLLGEQLCNIFNHT
ncbi:MAG: kynureninase [Flavobacteriales bacterium]